MHKPFFAIFVFVQRQQIKQYSYKQIHLYSDAFPLKYHKLSLLAECMALLTVPNQIVLRYAMLKTKERKKVWVHFAAIALMSFCTRYGEVMPFAGCHIIYFRDLF